MPVRNYAPFKAWALPPVLSHIQQQLIGHKSSDRNMVKLLLDVRQGRPALQDQVCQQELQLGGNSVDLVLNPL